MVRKRSFCLWEGRLLLFSQVCLTFLATSSPSSKSQYQYPQRLRLQRGFLWSGAGEGKKDHLIR